MSELPGPYRGRPRKRIKLSLEKPFIPEQLRNVLIDDHHNINNEQCQI